LGNFLLLFLLNILCFPLVHIYSPSSILLILRFGLLMELLIFYKFISQLLSCLTKNSVFSLISILSSSSDILSSTYSSLQEWFKAHFQIPLPRLPGNIRFINSLFIFMFF
jgi:hypothetical protein